VTSDIASKTRRDVHVFDIRNRANCAGAPKPHPSGNVDSPINVIESGNHADENSAEG